MPMSPQVYADLLFEKIHKHDAHVWLVNTGWTGGRYGIGKRISLQDTRNIINAIHDGKIHDSDYETLPVFNISYPKKIEGVNNEILNPKKYMEEQR